MWLIIECLLESIFPIFFLVSLVVPFYKFAIFFSSNSNSIASGIRNKECIFIFTSHNQKMIYSHSWISFIFSCLLIKKKRRKIRSRKRFTSNFNSLPIDWLFALRLIALAFHSHLLGTLSLPHSLYFFSALFQHTFILACSPTGMLSFEMVQIKFYINIYVCIEDMWDITFGGHIHHSIKCLRLSINQRIILSTLSACKISFYNFITISSWISMI